MVTTYYNLQKPICKAKTWRVQVSLGAAPRPQGRLRSAAPRGIMRMCRQAGLRVISSATAYRSGGGDEMTNVELLSILLSVAGLIVGVFALALTLKR